MPIFPERSCWADLFLMANQYGGIITAAKKHQTWDKESLTNLGNTLVGLQNSCVLIPLCRESAIEVMTQVAIALNEYEEVDPLLVDDQLFAIGNPLATLVGCLMDNYAVASDVMLPSQPFTDWPDDEDWLATIKPERLRTVR